MGSEKYLQMSDVNSMKAGDFTSWTNFSLADRAQVRYQGLSHLRYQASSYKTG